MVCTNFDAKVLHAQLAGASAVVVTDTPATDKWLMVMYGDPENTQVRRFFTLPSPLLWSGPFAKVIISLGVIPCWF